MACVGVIEGETDGWIDRLSVRRMDCCSVSLCQYNPVKAEVYGLFAPGCGLFAPGVERLPPADADTFRVGRNRRGGRTKVAAAAKSTPMSMLSMAALSCARLEPFA